MKIKIKIKMKMKMMKMNNDAVILVPGKTDWRRNTETENCRESPKIKRSRDSEDLSKPR